MKLLGAPITAFSRTGARREGTRGLPRERLTGQQSVNGQVNRSTTDLSVEFVVTRAPADGTSPHYLENTEGTAVTS